MSASELDSAADALGKAYTRDPEDKDRHPLRQRAADGGEADQALAVMRKLAIAIPRTATCSPPTARRWPPPASSNRRSTRCAARRPGISRLEAGFGRRRDPRPARPDERGARSSTARRLTSSRTNLRSFPISACPMCWKAISAPPRPICARPRSSRTPTAASGRTWRWSSACRAASTRPRRSPAGAFARTGAGQLTYLRPMLAQQNAWSQIKDQDKAKTSTN